MVLDLRLSFQGTARESSPFFYFSIKYQKAMQLKLVILHRLVYVCFYCFLISSMGVNCLLMNILPYLVLSLAC